MTEARLYYTHHAGIHIQPMIRREPCAALVRGLALKEALASTSLSSSCGGAGLRRGGVKEAPTRQVTDKSSQPVIQHHNGDVGEEPYNCHRIGDHPPDPRSQC